jgi:hypothetical protein
MCNTYNGYTNYPTWLLNLNLNSDEFLQSEAMKIAKNCDSISSFKNEIEQLLTDMNCFNDKLNVYHVFDSFDSYTWSQIDWREIKESMECE